jgi:hypothetical protein
MGDEVVKVVVDPVSMGVSVQVAGAVGAVRIGKLTESAIRTREADVPLLEGRIEFSVPLFIDDPVVGEEPAATAPHVIARLTTAALEDVIQKANAELQQLTGFKARAQQLETQGLALAAENAQLRAQLQATKG